MARMKNIVLIVAVLCCIGTTCLYLTQDNKQIRLLEVLNDLQYDYKQKQESQAFQLATLREDMNTRYANESETLKSNMLLLENGKNKINLSDVIKDKTLIVRLSQQNCQACIMAITPLQNDKGKTFPFNVIVHSYKNEFVAFGKGKELRSLTHIKDKKVREKIESLGDNSACLIFYELE